MKNVGTNTLTTALVSALLALPFTALFLAFISGFEPSIEPLARMFDVNESRIGSLVVFASFGLFVAAFFVSLKPVLRNLRTGRDLSADPINLILASLCLSLILLTVGAIIVDQYPCWIGVPNCD